MGAKSITFVRSRHGEREDVQITDAERAAAAALKRTDHGARAKPIGPGRERRAETKFELPKLRGGLIRRIGTVT